MHRIHEAFPTIVYQGMVECHNDFKNKNLNSLREYWFDGYQNESPEYSGRIFLQLNSEYEDFFKELKTHINNYFAYLSVEYDKLSYHVVKSWVGLHKDNETPSIKPHTHNESNLSFVYYVNTDESSDKFCIAQDRNNNQCVEDLFETSVHRNLITEFSRYNCNYYTITPTEGSVLIFPSKVPHFTQKFAERLSERMVIAGDVRVTMNENSFDYHQGCTHPSQWKEI